MKRLRREIKVQDLKIGMKIRFSGELEISGLETDKTYDTVYEGEVSWIQNDGKNIFITVFLINSERVEYYQVCRWVYRRANINLEYLTQNCS